MGVPHNDSVGLSIPTTIHKSGMPGYKQKKKKRYAGTTLY